MVLLAAGHELLVQEETVPQRSRVTGNPGHLAHKHTAMQPTHRNLCTHKKYIMTTVEKREDLKSEE